MLLPDILTRLKEMHDEIDGITAFRTPPPIVAHEQLPLLYGMALPFTETKRDAYFVHTTYNIGVDVLVLPIFQQNKTTEGVSEAVQTAHTWIDTLYDYYNTHREMTTALHPDMLAGLDPSRMGMEIQCDGMVIPLVAHDEQSYIGTQFTLTIHTIARYRT